MMNALKRFWNDEEGVTMIEYTLIAALISIAAVVIIGSTGDAINSLFTSVESEISGATTTESQ
ncbi:Flp family type IVb pilin [Desulfovermiculus halophilus]|jgi:pilus assembly protein Flp/PilA|uniref:Flp family type IVb pilin n=1 Tax=Desulfovermiculus halophilus TaxID=339722 RepID=UPI000480602C|nr:Flp family type IVb pilin [Desulfovermiculus halophilus]